MYALGMLRISLPSESAHLYFNKVREHTSMENLAQELDVSPRTINDWKRSRYTFPMNVGSYIRKKYKVDLPKEFKYVSLEKLRKKSGSLGGHRRFELYGSPATSAGRIKGGRNSIETHKRNNSGFKTLQTYALPKMDSMLAEFVGIVLGDGHISENQVSIYLNKETDKKYIHEVCQIIEKLFGYKVTPRLHKTEKLATMTISSKFIVKYMNELGLPVGNKMKNNVVIPSWILNKKLFGDSLRGLFDTDGCVSLDRHTYKTTKYASPVVIYTAYNKSLLLQIFEILKGLGFNPTRSTLNRLMIRRRGEVSNFFSIIQPRNKKHINKYQLMT